MKPAIRVNSLSKQYRLPTGPRAGYGTLAEALSGSAKAVARRLTGRREATAGGDGEFWALKDVSFEVEPGEVVGVVGRNGAGKSTLLKLLTRVVEPTAGRAEIRGRMGSLLEVGTGFHPELSGRENIFLNGSVLGMTRREVARKFDAIVAYSGVEQFLDTPVKRYSSGMYVRLAFAVAAHLEPEILIVDEVLAVGDAEFQKRCLDTMRSVSRTGRTVVLVSHNLTVVDRLCGRVLTLQRGRAVGFGPAADQIREYLRQATAGAEPAVDLVDHPARVPGSTAMLTGLTVLTADGVPGTVTRMGAGFGFELSYRLPRKPNDLRVGIVIENAYGVRVAAVSPTFQDPGLLADPPAEGVIRGRIPTHNLVAGTYLVNAHAQADGRWDTVEPAAELQIEAGDVFGTGVVPDAQVAVAYLPCAWEKQW